MRTPSTLLQLLLLLGIREAEGTHDAYIDRL
jgi:hypothetical protein